MMGAIAERPDPRLPTTAQGDCGSVEPDRRPALVTELHPPPNQIRAVLVGNDHNFFVDWCHSLHTAASTSGGEMPHDGFTPNTATLPRVPGAPGCDVPD